MICACIFKQPVRIKHLQNLQVLFAFEMKTYFSCQTIVPS
jgi:hypothetical protein